MTGLVPGAPAATYARIAATAATRADVAAYATAHESATDGEQFAADRRPAALQRAHIDAPTECSRSRSNEAAAGLYTSRLSQSGDHKSRMGGRVLQ